MVDLFHYERKYELAFEGHRYFDIRRGQIAEQVMNSPAMGINIVAKLNPDKITHTLQAKIVSVGPWSFNAKACLSPIPVSEIHKNSKLILLQNNY